MRTLFRSLSIAGSVILMGHGPAWTQVAVTGNEIATYGAPGFYLTTTWTGGAQGNLLIADTLLHQTYAGTSCLNTFDFTMADRLSPLGGSSGADVTRRPSLLGGVGQKSFYLEFNGYMFIPEILSNQIPLFGIGWDLLVDGDLVVTPNAIQQLPGSIIGDVNQGGDFPIWGVLSKLRVTHQAGDAFNIPGNIREFRIRPYLRLNPSGTLRAYCPSEIRFEAVMVGNTFSDIQGYFNTPEVPMNVLRDPPGDGSYATFTEGSTNCVGEVVSAAFDENQESFLAAKIGASGSVGFGGIFSFNFEIYSETTGTMSGGREETTVGEYRTCLTTTEDRSTSPTGPPDDLFFGSSVRYAYGSAFTVSRNGCAAPTDTAQFLIEPVEQLSSFDYPESYIRNTLLPTLQLEAAALPTGTPLHNEKVRQVSVWQQALALNDAIKEESMGGINRNFTSGGQSFDYSQTTTSEETRSIGYNVYLEEGLSEEFCVNFGGSGVTAGGSVGFRQSFGSTNSTTNESTNTVAYHLEDGGDDDIFSIFVRPDRVFANNIYVLDSANSRTSCPYEGGYQIDQPQLWVGSIGSSEMVLNEVPIGGEANFPLLLCNNSNEERTYKLAPFDGTVQSPAFLAFGPEPALTEANPLSFTITANSCRPLQNLSLTQNGLTNVEYNGIVMQLYSDCEPGISSTVTLSANFGEGNTGSYCIPTSANAGSDGDWVDGVQIGSISNTGSGGINAPAYTDYTAQFSTALSRNGQAMVTITSGAYTNNRYAAWIDYDQSGTFEANEKLGEFVTNGPFQSQNITFTVPANAALGTTVLRVRGAFSSNPMDACFPYNYGETEDYGVVIDANTPVDCAGVPNGGAHPGTACDDGNAATGNDLYNANCTCVGQIVDCAGTPNGTAVAGTPCNDGDPNTVGDVYDGDCNCVGQLIDCAGVPGGSALPGAFCDDGDPNTALDTWDADCNCVGLQLDCVGTPGGSALPGAPCNDFNPLTTDDTWNANCNCVGVLELDCLGVPGGAAQPGTPCDDGDPSTGNDVFGPNCLCAGIPLDCAGTPGGNALPGTPCNDFDPQTTNDTWTADCNCFGTLPDDCLGIPGGSTQPGSPCDDGDPLTGNDAYDTNCNCAGLLVDCLGIPGGSALPGLGCDDGDPLTGNDTYDADCNCVGLLIDCENVPGGNALPGTPCDDGNPDTSNDTWTTGCVCAGVLPNDCAGVPGGTAQPGTPCDDGDADTGNDTWNNACECVGIPIDCAGVIGGPALPGVACNDNDPCTIGDVWSADCGCSGTVLSIGAINGPEAVDVEMPITLYVNPVPGATAYNWSLPADWSSSSTSDFVLVAIAGSTAGPVEVCVDVVANGCDLQQCQTVTVTGTTSVASSTEAQEAWFTVSPNPSNGQFLITPSRSLSDAVTVRVFDGTGRAVGAPEQLAGNTPFILDLGHVAAGAYYLWMQHGDRKRVSQLIVQP